MLSIKGRLFFLNFFYLWRQENMMMQQTEKSKRSNDFLHKLLLNLFIDDTLKVKCISNTMNFYHSFSKFS